jgi:hypothetical protein
MDLNEYLAATLAESRLAEARATARRAALLASLRPARRGARVALGRWLIAAGRRLAARARLAGGARRPGGDGMTARA